MTAAAPLSGEHQARMRVVERSAGLGARHGRSRGVEAGAEWVFGGQFQLGYEDTSVAGLVPLGASAPADCWRHGVVASGRLPLLR